jgi:hypothetical protein
VIQQQVIQYTIKLLYRFGVIGRRLFLFYIDHKNSWSLLETIFTTNLLGTILKSAYAQMFLKLLFIILILA